MLTEYEKHLLTRYLANIASCLRRRDPEARKLAEWVADEDNRIAFPAKKRRSADPWDRRYDETKVSAKKCAVYSCL